MNCPAGEDDHVNSFYPIKKITHHCSQSFFPMLFYFIFFLKSPRILWELISSYNLSEEIGKPPVYVIYNIKLRPRASKTYVIRRDHHCDPHLHLFHEIEKKKNSKLKKYIIIIIFYHYCHYFFFILCGIFLFCNTYLLRRFFALRVEFY